MGLFGTRKDKRVYKKRNSDDSVAAEVARRLGDFDPNDELHPLPAKREVVMKKYFQVIVVHNKGKEDEFSQEWGTATQNVIDRDEQIAAAKDRYPESYVTYETLELEGYA